MHLLLLLLVALLLRRVPYSEHLQLQLQGVLHLDYLLFLLP